MQNETVITHSISNVLNDFAASDWLKKAIRELLERDCVDAAMDAKHLANIFAERRELDAVR